MGMSSLSYYFHLRCYAMVLYYVIIIALLFSTYSFAQPTTSCAESASQFENTITLNEAVNYTLQYRVDDQQVFIRLTARTTGWIGFGISESGHMVGSDIVTAMIVDGQPVVEDRFAHWNAHPFEGPTPQLDRCNDWKVICATEGDGFTDVVLSRALSTGDSQDRAIENRTIPVIFAWGEFDFVTYHGNNRGSTYMSFFQNASSHGTDFAIPNGTDRAFDLVLSDYEVSTDRTQYVLQKFDLGEDARHIIAIEPLVRDEDLVFAHHMVIHDCGDSAQLFPLILIPDGTPINARGISPLGIGACTGMIAAWGKGGQALSFPQEAGYKTGVSAARHIILEFHLDNPSRIQNRTVRSGVRLYTTTQLRPNDVGVIVLGDATVKFDPIPRFTPRAHYESTCPKECTQTFQGEIHVFRTFPHMHSYGKELWTTLYDDVSNTSRTISHRQFWNFNFQDTLREVNVTVKPNDWLSTHCVYDTTKAPSNIEFGASSNDEMCMDFVMYYPKANAGLNCGFKSPTETVCRNGIILNVANPQPDGQTDFPSKLAHGNPPEHCSLEDGSTASPSFPETTVNTEEGGNDQSSAALEPPAAQVWGTSLAFLLACIVILLS